MKRGGTLTAALLATTALIAVPAVAQDATWSASPASSNFEDAANWVGGSVPTGTATFGASSGQSILANSPVTIGGFTFTAGHPGYGFNFLSGLTFTGAGIGNTGSFVSINALGGLTFRNASSTTAGVHINNFGGAEFLDTSSAGGSMNSFAALAFRDSSSAGTANIANFGTIDFHGSSSAGTGSITNSISGSSTTFRDSTTAGSAGIGNSFGGTTTFTGGSTAGSAGISNSLGGTTTFGDDSSAGSATITNFNGSSTTFNGSSSAAGATITSLLSSALIFNDSSTAGAAIVINDSSSSVSFNQSSSAGSAAITNYATGSITFSDSSTAGTAHITNSGAVQFSGTSTAASSTITNYEFTIFQDLSSAGSATITNQRYMHFGNGSTAGSATIVNFDGVSFFGASTAAASSITNYGTLFFNDSSTAGSAAIANGNTLRFYNSSSAGNATIINNGFARFEATSTAGSAVIVNSGWTTFRDMSSAGTATITNSATLSFEDGSTAGAAAITNTNAVSFNASSTAGNAAIANAAGALIGFNGSSSAGSATITNAGEIDFAEHSTTGQATFNNTGIITLMTTNTTGTATVLVQGPAGVLRGYGSVGNTTVEAGGTFMPLAGTLRVNGDLTMQTGSTFAVTPYGLASITGTATLGGATLSAPQATFQARSYTFLTADGGVSGTFAIDAATSPFASLIYGTHDVTLTISAYRAGVALTGAGGTNARNVAAGIDRVLDGGATPAAFNPLLSLYGAPLAHALNSLSGEAGAAAPSTALTGASTFLGIMLDPMGGSRGAMASAPGSSLIEMADTAAARTPAARVEAAWSIWTRAYGAAGRTASDASTGAAGSASSLYGVAAGAEKLVSPGTLVGFAIAGGGTSFGLGTRGTGTGDFAQLGLYASTRLGPAYVSAALAYGWNRFDISRAVDVLGVNETYRSGPVSHTFGGRIEAGRRFAFGAAGLTPYLAGEAIAYATPGYRETFGPPDSGALALTYAGRTAATLRGEAGIRADAVVASGPSHSVHAFGRLAYAGQTNTQRAAEASFQQLANTGFTVFGARASTHTALATLGVEARLRQGSRVGASLDGELGNRHRSLRANVSFSQSW